ncbi:hypothetical protein DFP72DRAFT_893361 [Ephemerocybe angulata]|uniref:Uncharacterized protein n=1 Tax=Ephemerocybe angulata TaxID=980116 RepID=A0A8H6I3B3_9AGAR|nr:hypothetical protein DFP72DRAFT_893361 [Tulosesus angulatus]
MLGAGWNRVCSLQSSPRTSFSILVVIGGVFADLAAALGLFRYSSKPTRDIGSETEQRRCVSQLPAVARSRIERVVGLSG